jgi:hypothetical protein
MASCDGSLSVKIAIRYVIKLTQENEFVRSFISANWCISHIKTKSAPACQSRRLNAKRKPEKWALQI